MPDRIFRRLKAVRVSAQWLIPALVLTGTVVALVLDPRRGASVREATNDNASKALELMKE